MTLNEISRDIRQIKLINGEEIITEVVGEDREEILIRNPLKVHRERMQLGDIAREANMFTRWMGFCEVDEHLIKKQNILVEGLVNDVVAMYYHRMMENVEADHKEPIQNAAQSKNPDVVQATPTLHLDGDEEPPTYH